MHDRNQKVASCLSKVKAAIAAVLLLMVVGTGTALPDFINASPNFS